MIILNESDAVGMIVWFFMFFIFMFLYPRLMLSQMIYKLEQSARKMEELSERANSIAARKITPQPSKEIKKQIDDFSDFFVVEPSNLDPYGIVKKIDLTIRGMESRFDMFVDEVAGDKSFKDRQEINYTLRASIGLRQLSKMVRHFVEMSKKFKNLQIAMILQMQLPIIEKIAEGEYKGAEAFSNGWPIGDSIGPLVAASFVDDSKPISKGVVAGTTAINGRKCFVLKATGPEPHLGRIDEAIEKIMKKNRIARVITIDAAGKLEGEKTGSVAEGVGFAMGGIGQRDLIENSLIPKKIPVDSVVVKVGLTEAIEPMRKEIYEAVPNVKQLVEKAVNRAKKSEKVIIIGVGNSCGIGNNKKSVEKVKIVVEHLDKRLKKEESKKKGGWL